MSRILLVLMLLGCVHLRAEVKQDQEIVLEELFTEEDLAALKDEDEALLFDEITQAEQDPEELFQTLEKSSS
jgi:hypothetical protein